MEALEAVPRTLTYQVIDLKHQPLWLFRFHSFDRRPLTDEIMAVDNPWYYIPPGNTGPTVPL